MILVITNLLVGKPFRVSRSLSLSIIFRRWAILGIAILNLSIIYIYLTQINLFAVFIQSTKMKMSFNLKGFFPG